MNNFDPVEHKYTMSGVDVPSVTQVLPLIEFYCTDEQLEAARQDGVGMHAAMELYFDMEMSMTFDDPDVIEFDKLFRENQKYLGEPVLHETTLFSVKHRFAGKPDIIFSKAMADFKRSPQDKLRVALQIAGYMILAVENKIIKSTKKWYACYRSGKSHKMVNIYNDQAEKIFLACVRKWHIEQAINNYMRG